MSGEIIGIDAHPGFAGHRYDSLSIIARNVKERAIKRRLCEDVIKDFLEENPTIVLLDHVREALILANYKKEELEEIFMDHRKLALALENPMCRKGMEAALTPRAEAK